MTEIKATEEKCYSLITQIGQAKIANAIAYGRQLKLITFALGDGGGASYEPSENQTALKREVYRANVANIVVVDEAVNIMEISMTVPPDQGGFTVREMGVFDIDGNLIVIAKVPADVKPSIGTGSAKDITYRMRIAVTNTDAVEIKIDGTVITATKAEVEKVSARLKLLEDGLIVFASEAPPVTPLKKYVWFQVIQSKATEGAEPVLLKTGAEATSGYHVEVDRKREVIENAVASPEQAGKDDIIIIEV